jgi:hypothetical protein
MSEQSRNYTDPWSGLGPCQQAFQKYIIDNAIPVSTEYGSTFLAAKQAFVSGWDAHECFQHALTHETAH